MSQPEIARKKIKTHSTVFERGALQNMLLLRWGVDAVGRGSLTGGAAGGARFGVLRLSEGRITSRDYVGRERFP